VGACKHVNEPLGLIKVGNCLNSWASISI